FTGDGKSSGSTKSIVPYCSFNQDLNRYILKVKNLDGDKAKVTWGADSKVFTKAELEAGINLNEHFFNNPFVPEWSKFEQKVLAKQSFETSMIKDHITRYPGLSNMFAKDKDVDGAIETLRKKFLDRQAQLSAEVRAAVVPMKHTILVAVEK